MRRLLIRSGAIGDCIVALPAMEYLRSEYTEVWVPSAIVPLIQFAQKVRAISSTGINRMGLGDDPPLHVRDLLASFHEIVSWYGSNRPEFRSEVASINPNTCFFQALPGAGDYPLHVTDFLAQQVGAPFGLHPAVKVTPAARRDSIVIHPFSGSPGKNWPLENYLALEAGLTVPVEWVAGPDEQLANARRFEDLLELGTWIAGARTYVGNDSGITHLAAACGATTVAIFGAASSDVWLPRGETVKIIRGENLNAVTPAAVTEQLSTLSHKTGD